MNKRLLIVFVKNPELGKCKTRLAATIGDNKALNFYKNMLQRTLEVSANVAAEKAIYYSSFIDENDFWPDDNIYHKMLQIQGDLGAKMQAAFRHAFDQGYQSVMIIGSDCYALDEEVINRAFKLLQAHDAVLGPSTDGGYYLLGTNQFYSKLFENKAWSTSLVTAQTLRDFEQEQIDYALLEALTDIDTEEDLQTLPHEIIVAFTQEPAD